MKKELKIEGMSCMHCVKHATDALQAVPGVSSVNVDLESKTAKLELSAEVSNDALKKAVANAGYSVTEIH